MTKEQLKQEAEEYFRNLDDCKTKELMIEAYLAGAEPREKRIAELEAQLKTVSLKIISCIKTHLCKQDEDYDKAIISPKFLSDIFEQMFVDGFEEIKENE